jgi:acetyltransferase-like isoleucine patch superfamily enzyme
MMLLFQKTAARAVGLATRTLQRRWELARQWLLGADAQLDPTCRVYLSARLQRLGGARDAIRVGAHTHVRGEVLVAAHGGRVVLGDWCFVGENARLWSASSIVVGDRVLIAHDCQIHDWNAHPVDARQRHQQFRDIVERGHPSHAADSESAPIRIEDDAWIGFGATILKDVTVGARSIVAARAVVLDDVPPDCIVAGFPARPVRSI